MKHLLVFLSYVISFNGYAQKHYSCEASKMGKLIMTPITESGVIHYEKAGKYSKEHPATETDGVAMNEDSLGNKYITRFLEENGKHVELLFIYYVEGKDCRYQLTSIENKQVSAVRLDGEGRVLNWDEREQQSDKDRKNLQSWADEQLKNFK